MTEAKAERAKALGEAAAASRGAMLEAENREAGVPGAAAHHVLG
jgi:hypothetical protein